MVGSSGGDPFRRRDTTWWQGQVISWFHFADVNVRTQTLHIYILYHFVKMYIYYTIISIHSLHIFSTHSFFHTTILYHNSYTISFRFDHPRLGVETSFDERNERNAPLDPRRCSASPPRSADSARTAAAGRRPHRTRPGVRILWK